MCQGFHVLGDTVNNVVGLSNPSSRNAAPIQCRRHSPFVHQAIIAARLGDLLFIHPIFPSNRSTDGLRLVA